MTDTAERPDVLDVDFGAFDEATKQLHDGSERMTDGWKVAGASMIDAYSRAMNSLFDLGGIMIDTQLKWTSAFGRAQLVTGRQAQTTRVRLVRDLFS